MSALDDFDPDEEEQREMERKVSRDIEQEAMTKGSTQEAELEWLLKGLVRGVVQETRNQPDVHIDKISDDQFASVDEIVEQVRESNTKLCGNAGDGILLTYRGGCRNEVNIRDCYRCTGCGGRFHKDCILKHFELEKEHDWGRQQERHSLLEEMLKALDGLEVDREATEQHIRKVAKDDAEIEQALLSMEIDADNRHDVPEDVRKSISALLTKTEHTTMTKQGALSATPATDAAIDFLHKASSFDNLQVDSATLASILEAVRADITSLLAKKEGK